jgi:hypothetical protein
VHTTLFWLLDTQNIAKFFSKGSDKTAIMLQSLDIVATARSLNLNVFAVWVRRNSPHLVKDNALSKHVNTDNWSVMPEGFDAIMALASMSFTINLFATAANAQIDKLYCLTFETGCAGVNTFARLPHLQGDEEDLRLASVQGRLDCPSVEVSQVLDGSL